MSDERKPIGIDLEVMRRMNIADKSQVNRELEVQFTKIKQEVYRVRKILERHPHDEQRIEATIWLDKIFAEFQKLAQWIDER